MSHLLTACCDLATHLYKHSKEELRAELLDSLGHGLLVITVRCLFMDLLCWQPQTRSTICIQAFTNTRDKQITHIKVTDRHSRSRQRQEAQKQWQRQQHKQLRYLWLLCSFLHYQPDMSCNATAALFETNGTFCYLFKYVCVCVCVCVCFCVRLESNSREGTHSVKKPAVGGQWCQRSVWWVMWSECREERWGRSA